jgi:hypothetical protein
MIVFSLSTITYAYIFLKSLIITSWNKSQVNIVCNFWWSVIFYWGVNSELASQELENTHVLVHNLHTTAIYSCWYY